MSQPKLLTCEETIGEEKKQMIVCQIIRREERIIWDAWEELILFGFSQAAAKMRGLFRFQLHDIDLKKGHQSFNPQNFAQLVINRAKALKAGEECVISYTSLVGVLKLKVETSWGKIDFEHAVQTFLDEPEKLDLFLNKILLATDALTNPKIEVRDLSSQPILEPENIEQRERLGKWLSKIGSEKSALFYITAGSHTFQLNELFKHPNGGG